MSNPLFIYLRAPQLPNAYQKPCGTPLKSSFISAKKLERVRKGLQQSTYLSEQPHTVRSISGGHRFISTYLTARTVEEIRAKDSIKKEKFVDDWSNKITALNYSEDIFRSVLANLYPLPNAQDLARTLIAELAELQKPPFSVPPELILDCIFEITTSDQPYLEMFYENLSFLFLAQLKVAYDQNQQPFLTYDFYEAATHILRVASILKRVPNLEKAAATKLALHLVTWLVSPGAIEALNAWKDATQHWPDRHQKQIYTWVFQPNFAENSDHAITTQTLNSLATWACQTERNALSKSNLTSRN